MKHVSKTIDPAEEAKSSVIVRRVCAGPVLPVGGAEDKSEGCEILARFVDLAGGAKARIAVIPAASSEPREAAKLYRRVFIEELNASSIDMIACADRHNANEPGLIDRLDSATGVFITGGDQARLVSGIVGTVLMEAIRKRNQEGMIVAGTSAGASILADHLLVGTSGVVDGASGDTAARRSMVDVGAGLGLIHDAVIDQHFSERGRIGRLLSVFATMPGLLAIGLDENTAALFRPEGTIEVIGSGSVTILDGVNATSDYFDRDPGDVLTVVDCSLHVLGPGQQFNTNDRRPLLLSTR